MPLREVNLNVERRGHIAAPGKQNLLVPTKPTVGTFQKKAVKPKVAEKPKESEVKQETQDVEELTNAFSSQMLSIDNIDLPDGNNPQFLAQYVNEIYDYMRILEDAFPVRENYLAHNTGVTPSMRSILIDWLVQVHGRFHLLPETLYLTVAIVDRYLQNTAVDKSKLQLVGVAAMWVAAKYEELMCPEVHDFVFITDNAFNDREIRQMECSILKRLDFSLGKPLPLHFLRRNSKAGYADVMQHTLAKYLMEVILTDYECCHHKPSEIAAAALCLAQKILEPQKQEPLWNATLVHYSHYKEEDLLPVMKKMAFVVLKAEAGKKIQAVKNKYSHNKLMKVSQLPELMSEFMVSLGTAEKARRGK